MKKKNIIVCILVLILILSMVAVISISLIKEDKIDTIPVNETDNIEKEIAEPIDQFEQIEKENESLPSLSEESSEEFIGYRLATEDDKANYTITNIKKTSDSKITKVTGKIKNNGGSEQVIVKVLFNGNVVSSSSMEIKGLKVNQEKEFELKVLNNVASDDFQVYVEYVGE